MSALATLEAQQIDPLAAAAHWKRGGGRVVGYLCDNVPVELIEAAGFLPLRLQGGAREGAERVRTTLDPLFPPDITSRPVFVDALLERLLDGTYSMLDYLVIPHGRDAIQSIYRQLNTARSADPSLQLPELFYLDKAWCPSGTAAAFDRDSVRLFREALERWSQQPMNTDRLREFVQRAREHRILLQQVLALRDADPPRLTGVAALAILASAQRTPRREHMDMLLGIIERQSTLDTHEGVRVFVGGSPLDHPQVYAAIEASGAVVVGEDHCWGRRIAESCATDDPSPTADPLENLAARYHARSACSIALPLAASVAACSQRALRARARAAIFFVMAEDWKHNWETPAKMRALESLGIPCLHLPAQRYAAEDDGSLRQAIRDFLARVAA